LGKWHVNKVNGSGVSQKEGYRDEDEMETPQVGMGQADTLNT